MILIINSVLLISIFITVYIYFIYRIDKKIKEEQGELSLSLYQKLNIYLGGVKEGYFSYERIRKYLKKTGNTYNLTPLGYITLKLLIPAIFLFLFIIIGNAYIPGIILAILGYFILDILIKQRDKKDMKAIKFELRDIYDSLKMQITAGVFIGDALKECYLIASNKRFKNSLAILSAEIALNNNIDAALDNFLESFNSEEIKNFVLSIKQSLKTNKIKEQLEDQSEQINEMNLIVLQDATKKINDKVTVIQLLVFAGIFVATFYFCLTLIPTNGISNFN